MWGFFLIIIVFVIKYANFHIISHIYATKGLHYYNACSFIWKYNEKQA